MWKVLNRVLKLSESVLGFTLIREQELSMRHLFNFIDVIQMFVMMYEVQFKKKKPRTGVRAKTRAHDTLRYT